MCRLYAGICGVVNSDPTWISSAFEGGYENASPDEVTVKLFRGTKRDDGDGAELEMEEEEHIVTYAEVSEDKDGDGQSDTYLGKAWSALASYPHQASCRGGGLMQQVADSYRESASQAQVSLSATR